MRIIKTFLASHNINTNNLDDVDSIKEDIASTRIWEFEYDEDGEDTALPIGNSGSGPSWAEPSPNHLLVELKAGHISMFFANVGGVLARGA